MFAKINALLSSIGIFAYRSVFSDIPSIDRTVQCEGLNKRLRYSAAAAETEIRENLHGGLSPKVPGDRF